MTDGSTLSRDGILNLTTDIVAAFLAHNTMAASEVPGFFKAVRAGIESSDTPAPAEQPELMPAVPIRASVKPDYIVCLEDGAKLKMLKRYLRTHFDLTPEQYRAKWKLPVDYPMVAPNYAQQRAEIAKQIGLGRTPRKTDEPRLPMGEEAPKRRNAA